MPPATESVAEAGDNEAKTLNKKRSKPHLKGHEITSRTIKTPPWTYIHLNLLTSDPISTPHTKLDLLTARTYLTNALTQFLGLSGSAIAVDFLKLEDGVENDGRCGDVWIRVPREDAGVFLAAVGGWVSGTGVGWKVLSWGNWLGALQGGSTTESVWND